MSRCLTDNEVQLVLKLVGPDFAEIDVVRAQLSGSTVTELDNGLILEFNILVGIPSLSTSARVLGQGSLYDYDGMPIVFHLLQKDGYIWRLDIARADSSRIRRPLDHERVVALGFGRGLSLEWSDDSQP